MWILFNFLQLKFELKNFWATKKTENKRIKIKYMDRTFEIASTAVFISRRGKLVSPTY